MPPLVLQDGLYSSSLDGMTLAGDLIVEIKVPYRGQSSTLWQAAAQAYLKAKGDAEQAAARLDAARAALVGLVQHPKESGAGVSVTRFWQAGSVDYKKVVELRGVDLEQCRR